MLNEAITLPIKDFCRANGMGETLCREMLRDGRLQAVRVGKKKLVVVVDSWREYVRKQVAEGTPEYNRTGPAVAARQAKRAEAKAGVDLKSLGLL